MFIVYNGGNLYSQRIEIGRIATWTQNASATQNIIPSNLTTPPELTTASILLGIIFLYLLFLPAGDLVWLQVEKKLNSPRSRDVIFTLPVRLGIGLIFFTITMTALSIVRFDAYVLSSWVIVTGILWAYTRVRNGIKFRVDRESAVSLAILGAITTIFVRIGTRLGWAPGGDNLIHGAIVSLTLYQHHLPTSYNPIASVPFSDLGFGYPKAFHVLATSTSIVTGMFPGQSLLIVALALVILIPCTAYVVIRWAAGSILWGLVGAAGFFTVVTGQIVPFKPSNDMLLFPLTYGTYPNLLGDLLFILFFGIVASVLDSHKTPKSIFWGFCLLVAAALGLSYYPYLSLIIPFLLLALLASIINLRENRFKLLGLVSFLLVVTAGLLILTLTKSHIEEFFQLNPSVSFNLYLSYNILSPKSPYVLFGVALIASFLISLSMIVTRRGTLADVLILSLSAIQLGELSPWLYYRLFWTAYPDRSLILVVMCCWVYFVARFGPPFMGMITEHRLRARRINPIGGRIGLMVVSAILVYLVAAGTVTYASPNLLTNQYVTAVPKGSDYVAEAWLASVAPPNQPILNDYSTPGLFLTSFGALNVVYTRELLQAYYLNGAFQNSTDVQRMLAMNRVFRTPFDQQYVTSTLSRYNISYVFLSSQVPNLSYSPRGTSIIPPYTLNSAARLMILDGFISNPHFTLVFKKGNTAVFRFTP